MYRIGQWAAAALLFLLLCAFFQTVLERFVDRSTVRARLRYRRRNGRLRRWTDRLGDRRPFRHVRDVLEASRSRVTFPVFLFACACLVLSGTAIGAFFFRSFKGVFALAAAGACLPYMIVRFRLIGRQLHARLSFLPAVETVYQTYLSLPGRNLRLVLGETVSSRRLPESLQPVFEQLHRNLTAGRDVEESLRLFELAVGHAWAVHFGNALRVGFGEGVDLASALRDLITDMRRAQRADLADKNRLLEIRISNYAAGFFLVLFLAVNGRLHPEASYRFYVLDPEGRDMLLNAVLLTFASFLMGVWLSLRRM